MIRRSKSQQKSGIRRFTPIEYAFAFCVLGSALAIAIPTTARELRVSRFSEPVEGLERIADAALAYAQDRPIRDAFPPTVGLTPEQPPRGKFEVDPPGTWDAPTWKLLGFSPVSEGCPHAFAFAFESFLGENESRFVARAHGDLDGDGVVSTFEVRGSVRANDPAGPRREPGMFVHAELE